MPAHLHHTIIPTSDKATSATYLADILELSPPEVDGWFSVVCLDDDVVINSADHHRTDGHAPAADDGLHRAWLLPLPAAGVITARGCGASRAGSRRRPECQASRWHDNGRFISHHGGGDDNHGVARLVHRTHRQSLQQTPGGSVSGRAWAVPPRPRLRSSMTSAPHRRPGSRRSPATGATGAPVLPPLPREP